MEFVLCEDSDKNGMCCRRDRARKWTWTEKQGDVHPCLPDFRENSRREPAIWCLLGRKMWTYTEYVFPENGEDVDVSGTVFVESLEDVDMSGWLTRRGAASSGKSRALLLNIVFRPRKLWTKTEREKQSSGHFWNVEWKMPRKMWT